MNILIDISHPAHVHLFRNTYYELVAKGHNVFITAKPTKAITDLLGLYNIPYITMLKSRDGKIGKALMVVGNVIKMLHIVRKNKIEVGVHGMTVTWVSRLTKMRSIILDDDDDAAEPLYAKYAHPYADAILSPDCIKRAAANNIAVSSYHELAYLHPHHFTPNKQVLKEIGIADNEPYFILRFNAFKAHHDAGEGGISIENRRKLVNYLKKYGRVFITTERDIDEEFRQYQLKISPEKVHSLMYYATMFIGDSQTMTSEAALLGTPAVKCNTFAGRLSVPNEIEQRYKLCYSFQPSNIDAFFKKIEELLNTPNIKELWAERRSRLLDDKIDYSRFLTWFIENYPQSMQEMKKDPSVQYQFK